MKKIIPIVVLNISLYFGQVVSGTVSDKITGLGLSGVNIIVIEKNAGVSTDSNGEFSLNIKDLTDDQIIQWDKRNLFFLFLGGICFALDMAMGGSTNTILHTLAIAIEAGLDFDLKELSQKNN